MRRKHDFTGDYVIQNARTMREQYLVMTAQVPGLSWTSGSARMGGHANPATQDEHEAQIGAVPFRFVIPGPPSMRFGVAPKPKDRSGKNLNRHLPVSTA